MKSYAKALLNCILNVYCSKRCINSVLEVLNGIWNQQKTKYKKLDSNEKAKTKTKDTNTKKQQNKTEKKEMGLHGWPPTKTRKKSNQKKNKETKTKKNTDLGPYGGSPTKTKKKHRFGTLEGRVVLSRVCLFFLVWFLWFWIFLVLVGDPPWGPKSLVFWFWFLWFWFFWSWFFLVLVGDPHGVLNLFFFGFGFFGFVFLFLVSLVWLKTPHGVMYMCILCIYIYTICVFMSYHILLPKQTRITMSKTHMKKIWSQNHAQPSKFIPSKISAKMLLKHCKSQ